MHRFARGAPSCASTSPGCEIEAPATVVRARDGHVGVPFDPLPPDVSEPLAGRIFDALLRAARADFAVHGPHWRCHAPQEDDY